MWFRNILGWVVGLAICVPIGIYFIYLIIIAIKEIFGAIQKEKKPLTPEEKKKNIKAYIIFIGGWILLIILAIVGKHYGW